MRVHSIFSSIDGEVNGYHQGALTTFVRFAGCNLNCSYCDTLFAMSPSQGVDMTAGEILMEVDALHIKKVTITGGEPLAQNLPDLKALFNGLLSRGYKVTVETNGAYSLTPFVLPSFSEIKWVVDYKLDSSGMTHRMIPEAFLPLRSDDFVKFVIMDRLDYEQAINVMRSFKQPGASQVKWAFSPVHDKLPAATLVQWLLRDKVENAFLNVQLHKILGLSEPG